eukprot:TRINITY_DN5137_c0_g1_i1.p2 TRINITY_DN5137_c0_g1~~TRINITY_DN5137_c0_g1_i1.p2  ORF type:complete len:71 (-),score=12.23 TRINITY_DN5137_c0_g1_i1:39-251(-)
MDNVTDKLNDDKDPTLLVTQTSTGIDISEIKEIDVILNQMRVSLKKSEEAIALGEDTKEESVGDINVNMP